MTDDALPLPAPIERALDALEAGGWTVTWRERDERTIVITATRGRGGEGWHLRTVATRPPLLPGGRGGWKTGAVWLRRRAQGTVTVHDRRVLPGIALASHDQLLELHRQGRRPV